MTVTVSELLSVQTGVLDSAADDLSQRASKISAAVEDLAEQKARYFWEGEGAIGASAAFDRISRKLRSDQQDLEARSSALGGPRQLCRLCRRSYPAR